MPKAVTTKSELEKAKSDGEIEIIVKGELADKLKKSKKIAMLSASALAILTIALGSATVTAPVTGGMSFFVAAPVAALTGVEIVAIITASAIGISFIVALFKEYEEIEYSKGNLVLRKRKIN